MNFDFYDVFTKLIPGGALTFMLFFCGYIPLSQKMSDMAFLISAYFIGFIIDAIAAKPQVMNIFWYFAKGKPSNLLLGGSTFYGKNYKFLFELKSKVGDIWDQENLDKTFDFIYRKVLIFDSKRVQGFNNHWINARNLLISLILSYIPLCLFIWNGDYSWYTSLFLSIVLTFSVYLIFDRAKSRQYYFVKEVLDSYLFTDKK
jgi:hypothetical protein